MTELIKYLVGDMTDIKKMLQKLEDSDKKIDELNKKIDGLERKIDRINDNTTIPKKRQPRCGFGGNPQITFF